MTVNLLVVVMAVVVAVIVFRSRTRREHATKASREHALQTVAPIVDGVFSNGTLTGTYQGHPVEASVQATGRIDATGDHHSSVKNFEVVLLLLHGVSGAKPWGFYTSVTSTGSLEDRWRSVITFAGVLGKLLGSMSAIPMDPAIDDRLRAGGMLEALERLMPRDVKAPYVLVSFIPDGAPAIASTVQRVEALGGHMSERARQDVAEHLKLGGHLRIAVERGGDQNPTPERFRTLLDASLAIAELNASLNR